MGEEKVLRVYSIWNTLWAKRYANRIEPAIAIADRIN